MLLALLTRASDKTSDKTSNKTSNKIECRSIKTHYPCCFSRSCLRRYCTALVIASLFALLFFSPCKAEDNDKPSGTLFSADLYQVSWSEFYLRLGNSFTYRRYYKALSQLDWATAGNIAFIYFVFHKSLLAGASFAGQFTDNKLVKAVTGGSAAFLLPELLIILAVQLTGQRFGSEQIYIDDPVLGRQFYLELTYNLKNLKNRYQQLSITPFPRDTRLPYPLTGKGGHADEFDLWQTFYDEATSHHVERILLSWSNPNKTDGIVIQLIYQNNQSVTADVKLSGSGLISKSIEALLNDNLQGGKEKQALGSLLNESVIRRVTDLIRSPGQSLADIPTFGLMSALEFNEQNYSGMMGLCAGEASHCGLHFSLAWSPFPAPYYRPLLVGRQYRRTQNTIDAATGQLARINKAEWLVRLIEQQALSTLTNWLGRRLFTTQHPAKISSGLTRRELSKIRPLTEHKAKASSSAFLYPANTQSSLSVRKPGSSELARTTQIAKPAGEEWQTRHSEIIPLLAKEPEPIAFDLMAVPPLNDVVEDWFDNNKSSLSNTLLLIRNPESEITAWAWVNIEHLAGMYPLAKEMSFLEGKNLPVRQFADQTIFTPVVSIKAPSGEDFDDSDLARAIFLSYKIRSKNGLHEVESRIEGYSEEQLYSVLYSLTYLSQGSPENESLQVANLILRKLEPIIVQRIYTDCFGNDFLLKRDKSGLVYVQLLDESSNDEEYGQIDYSEAVYKKLRDYRDIITEYFTDIRSSYSGHNYALERLLEYNLRVLGLFLKKEELTHLMALKRDVFSINKQIILHKNDLPDFLQSPFPVLSANIDYPLGTFEYDSHHYGSLEEQQSPTIMFPAAVLETFYYCTPEAREEPATVMYAHPTKAGHVLLRAVACKYGPANKW